MGMEAGAPADTSGPEGSAARLPSIGRICLDQEAKRWTLRPWPEALPCGAHKKGPLPCRTLKRGEGKRPLRDAESA